MSSFALPCSRRSVGGARFSVVVVATSDDWTTGVVAASSAKRSRPCSEPQRSPVAFPLIPRRTVADGFAPVHQPRLAVLIGPSSRPLWALVPARPPHPGHPPPGTRTTDPPSASTVDFFRPEAA
uniref:Uncharacterized protein n=1 Tax=Mycena chlorophos TaxID=658473 RepID=A0ABQ0L495_MYCCL|nr:predicted protein [Mycena chlorophos]